MVLKNKPLEHVDLVVVPPFVDIRSVTSVVESERDRPRGRCPARVSVHDAGAHTGEVSVSMLQRLNVKWVLVGHSERRAMYAMTDRGRRPDIARPSYARASTRCCAWAKNLSVREAEGHHRDFVTAQLHAALGGTR